MSKITCECGSSILASSVSRHQKTQKHREYQNRSRRAQNQSPRVQDVVRARALRAQEKEDRRVEQRSLPKHLIEIVLTHTEKTCMICYDDLDTSNAFLTRCGHLLCKGCEKIMYKKKNNACPCCRSEF